MARTLGRGRDRSHEQADECRAEISYSCLKVGSLFCHMLSPRGWARTCRTSSTRCHACSRRPWCSRTATSTWWCSPTRRRGGSGPQRTIFQRRSSTEVRDWFESFGIGSSARPAPDARRPGPRHRRPGLPARPLERRHVWLPVGARRAPPPRRRPAGTDDAAGRPGRGPSWPSAPASGRASTGRCATCSVATRTSRRPPRRRSTAWAPTAATCRCPRWCSTSTPPGDPPPLNLWRLPRAVVAVATGTDVVLLVPATLAVRDVARDARLLLHRTPGARAARRRGRGRRGRPPGPRADQRQPAGGPDRRPGRPRRAAAAAGGRVGRARRPPAAGLRAAAGAARGRGRSGRRAAARPPRPGRDGGRLPRPRRQRASAPPPSWPCTARRCTTGCGASRS